MTALSTGSAGLNVTNLERSVDFYRRSLGFDVIRQSTGPVNRYALMGSDGVVLLTLWEQSSGAFPVNRPGLHHLSFEAATLDDLRAAEKRLRTAGVALRDDDGSSEDAASAGQLFFADPDGIRLEIYTDDPAVPHGPTPALPRCGYFDDGA
ncbi:MULTISPECIES: VOC family protein [unclassified Streptomyces]|uniref:VOC family protein n=1 Tax=Streptomyces caledonius TaxID=3134107 RepID=A0ABU8U1C2_9ACTN|nr:MULTISPECIES: VOC family protein [unclassified Streptomyces]MBT2408173.1 VOC family protein [Streptomyces sp. ISL-21]MBT2609269.1 VOC family protein [Streptomyces sp. ISL-87]MCJ0874950.1 VOC family protein [Streptomyces sp. AP-93]